MNAIRKISLLVILVALAWFCSPEPLHAQQLTTTQLLDTLQHTAFNFFWNEANTTTGLIKDRSNADGGGGAPCSIASLGFGLTAICIGVDHGWVTREQARARVLAALNTLLNKPQGRDESGYSGYKGFYYHFLEMDTGLRTWTSELSTIDSGLLFAGVLYVQQYFDGEHEDEAQIRALADSIYRRADWEWFRNFHAGLLLGWTPERGFANLNGVPYGEWVGYNEAMIMYILGYGSPTHPLTEYSGNAWDKWTSGYSFVSYSGGDPYVTFGPLFGHQYSHCWIDFRGIQDNYMRSKGIDYFENSRRATLAQQAYAATNPNQWTGYSDSLWGITACDGPNGYRARGAPIGPGVFDDGTIAPTAAISSIVFDSAAVIPVIHNMWNNYHDELWAAYGFRDAFNLSVSQAWWASDVIGIDLGPIIIMIENYRTGKVWDVFMQSPYIQTGLSRIGFTPITSVEQDETGIPTEFRLEQNYPNPFNPTTNFEFRIAKSGMVTLAVYDLLGREVSPLVHEKKSPGIYTTRWDGTDHPSGMYYYRLDAGDVSQTRRMVLLK